MIELFGSIASILGFSLQLNELAKNKKDSQENLLFTTLFALSTSSKAWKELHSKYHPLTKSFSSIVGEISTYNEGILVPCSIGSIAPDRIRRLYYDGLITEAIYNFNNNTRKTISAISSSIMLDSNETTEIIEKIKLVDIEIAICIEDIQRRKREAYEIHEKFLGYLSCVKKFVGEPSWTTEHIKYVVDNRALLANDLHQMIIITDAVLMNFLDIYIRVVSGYGNESGLSTILCRR